MNKVLTGAGGGGGGPTIVKDNLRSQDSIEFIMGVCEGPVAGLIDGPKSFYLGDTPLRSATGENNFEAFELHTYLGSPDATPITTVFGGTASNFQVGVHLTQAVPVLRTTSPSLRGLIDRLEVRIVFDQLLTTNDDGDQLDATAEFLLQWRKTTGPDTSWKSFLGADYGGVEMKFDVNVSRLDRNPGVVGTVHDDHSAVLNTSGNLGDKDGLDATYTMVGGVVDTSVAGFNKRFNTTYGQFWFNTTTMAYLFVPNTAAISAVSSPQTVVIPFTGVAPLYLNMTAEVRITVEKPGYMKLKGKTGSAYVKEYVRRVPADGYTGDYEIRVEKLTTETDENLFVSMAWESFQCVEVTDPLKFNNLVVVRGLGATSNQFSNIPQFTGIWAGKLVKIPVNYDPVTRYYDGIWNGTFKLGYTDNPVWCLYDMLMDENYGAKKHYPRLAVDRFSFYEASQWCDVLVPRIGATGYQPRFTYHDLIDQPREGLGAAQYIASIFGGILTTDLNGNVRLKLDKPGAPVQIFGPESVTYEGFQYQFADMASRANDMLVTFVNPELDWAQDVRQVKVDSYIDANGRIPMDFVAVGCIDPFEAERRAYARLLSSNTEVTTVTFSATRPGILLEPYDIIGIVDPYMNWGLSGRIKSVVGSTINLREPLYLTAGASYTLTVQTVTGPLDLTVQNTGGAYSTTLLITSGTLPIDLPAHAQFALTSGSIGLVKPFRVLSINESEGKSDLYTITAIEINENKYTDADNMTLSPQQEYAFENSMIPAKPVRLQANSGTRHLYLNSDGRVMSRIYLTWEQDPTSFSTEFEVHYRRIDAEGYQMKLATGLDCYIDNVKDDAVYEIFMKSVNAVGRRSPATSVIRHTVIGKLAPPTTPINLVATQQGADVRLTWTGITDLDFSFYEIREGGIDWDTATVLGTSRTPVFTHTNIQSGNLLYRVKAVDTTGNYSTAAAQDDFTVAPPQALSVGVTLSGPNYVVSIIPNPTDVMPIREYVVTRNGTEVFRGVSSVFSARVDWTGSTPRTFSVIAVNTAGVVSTPTTAVLSISSPAAVTPAAAFVNTDAVLSWVVPASSLPIDHYVVRDVTTNLVLDNDLKATTYNLPVTWVGLKTFEIWAVDSAGNVGVKAITSLTAVAPAVENPQSILLRSQQTISWTGVPGTLPIRHYRVYLGDVFVDAAMLLMGLPSEFGPSEAGYRLATVDAENWSTLVNWNGTRAFYIIAEDVNGNLSLPVEVFETIDAPPAPTVTSRIVDQNIRLTWEPVVSELRLLEYQVFLEGDLVQNVSATTALIPIDFSGTKVFQVRAVDEAGNTGEFASVSISIVAPTSFSLTSTFEADLLRLSWTTPLATLPIASYVITRGALDTPVTQLTANSYNLRADWIGTETFKVTAYDLAGNASTVQVQNVIVNAPTAPTVTAEALDNNILLRWTPGSGSLPIDSTEIRRGATFATADVLQKVDATFAAFFEFEAGVYTYWLVHIDSAGNYGTPISKQVTMSEPPDFVLQADFNSTLNGTRTRVLLSDGDLYFGVDPSKTFANHFTDAGFASPNAQVVAGYPYYLQPTSLLASTYVETYDYGTVLSSSVITITPTTRVVSGNPTLKCDIEYRASTGDPWTLVSNTFQVYAQSFRYIRFTLTLQSDTADDHLVVQDINLRLNTRIKNDAGSATSLSTDVGGTTVLFNVDFVDVASISVTPMTTTPVIAVYDFADIPNPTQFKVYLFNQSGNRVTAPFSWAARGF